jgi:hypothetical protein
MDDDELIARVAGGDDAALREVFSWHAPWLAARIRRMQPCPGPPSLRRPAARGSRSAGWPRWWRSQQWPTPVPRLLAPPTSAWLPGSPPGPSRCCPASPPSGSRVLPSPTGRFSCLTLRSPQRGPRWRCVCDPHPERIIVNVEITDLTRRFGRAQQPLMSQATSHTAGRVPCQHRVALPLSAARGGLAERCVAWRSDVVVGYPVVVAQLVPHWRGAYRGALLLANHPGQGAVGQLADNRV